MRRVKVAIYNTITKGGSNNIISRAYDLIMFAVILISILPLTTRQPYPIFEYTKVIVVWIFVVDYILRWSTADIKYNDSSIKSYLRYPFSFMAIIDLLSILPGFNILGNSYQALRITRLFTILRAARLLRYSRHFSLLITVLKKEKQVLLTVVIMASIYILITALVIFNLGEEEQFDSFFKSVYWATTTLTTVGYGDIYPVSTAGRIISMISSVFGVAIIALPSGIITAGYLNELKIRDSRHGDTTDNSNK